MLRNRTPSSPNIVWGIAGPNGIAAAIERTPSQVRYLIKKKKLRVKKHGHRTYSALREHLLEDVAGEPIGSEDADRPP